jgi:hypothetical protein
MEFLVNFNNKLVKRMFFYRSSSIKTFNYKTFSSNKSLIHKILLQSRFRKKASVVKKTLLKNNAILQLLTNNKTSMLWKIGRDLNIKKNTPVKKKNTLINSKNKLSWKYFDSFIKRWFFTFDLFFFENEITSLWGPQSVTTHFDSFKILRLLNSGLINGSLFNFDVTLKIFFCQKGSSEVFFRNFDCK